LSMAEGVDFVCLVFEMQITPFSIICISLLTPLVAKDCLGCVIFDKRLPRQ
jgi:hypothetical protein